MDFKKLVKILILAPLIGCFIICVVGLLICFTMDYTHITFTGVEIVNSILGAIIVGYGFSLPSYVYDLDYIPFPLQILIQMSIGMFVLIIVGIYVKWIPPIELGFGPILEWIVIALIFCVVTWLGFYFYNLLEVKNLNSKIKSNLEKDKK